VTPLLAASSNSWIDLNALWKICVIGLICGAGLPAVFAIGLRLLSLPASSGGSAGSAAPPSVDDDRIYFGNVLGAVGAGICFAVVLAAIGLGIDWIVST